MRGLRYCFTTAAALCVAAASWADPTVDLNANESCYDPGDTVTVTIDLSGSGFANIVGGQFFLEFNTTNLTFGSAAAGDPWTIEIYESVVGNQITYAVGIPNGGTGATSGTMATLTFTAVAQICDTADLVSFRTTSPPTTLGDVNDAEYEMGTNLGVVDLEAITIDNTPPTITCPATVTVDTDAGLCTATGVALGTPTTGDNCSVASVTNDATEPYALGDTTVTWTVTDGSGNTATCTQTVTVEDHELPTITCPADVTVNADAGLCTATGVDLGTPTTADNCSVASVVNDGSEPYGAGDTTVTWTVTDGSGNTATCTQTVTVSAYNELVLDIDLVDMGASGTLTRCITFELFKSCSPDVTEVVTADVTFVNGQATSALVLVPCADYMCMTAQDVLHTLRQTDGDVFGIVGTQYVASFIDKTPGGDDDRLIGGNYFDDEYIDIMDFTIYVNRWGVHYDSDGDTFDDGNTPCSWTPPGGYHADMSGNGLVDVADFTFVQAYFLYAHELDCCGNLLMNEPRTEISIEELVELGLGHLAPADLTGDGWVDELDIIAFANGARPDWTPSKVPSGPLDNTAEQQSELAPAGDGR